MANNSFFQQHDADDGKSVTTVRNVIEWVLYLSASILFALFIVFFVGRFTIVDGNSMNPTLQNKNIILIESISMRLKGVQPNDIVVMKIPELLENRRTYAIKRVLAVEGQHVQIKNSKVYVDGFAVEESYVKEDTTLPGNGQFDDMVVPKDCIYVLGDNRNPDKSRDSRVFGPVKKARVIGKAFIRLFPFSKAGPVR
jgi:signal peptidase I